MKTAAVPFPAALLVVAAVALPLLPLLSGCGRATATAAPTATVAQPQVHDGTVSYPDGRDPPSVKVAVVAAGGQRALAVPGRLTWDDDRTARIYAPFSGRVERVRVNVGQPVHRGDALADLASGDIGQAQADLQKAEADRRVALAGAQRARELAAGGVIAQKDLQQAEADLQRAQAEAARAQARLAQYGVAANGVTQAMALKAPLAGVVVERNLNPGTEVRSDTQGPPLFTVSDPTQLVALLDVAETQLSAFKPGDAVQLTTAAWPEATFPATVTWVSESVDPASRTVKVRARVANPQRRLKAEMFVTANANVPAGLPTIPADAVVQRGTRAYAFVQQAPGRYVRREVQVRSAGPQSWFVAAGLQPGERVVLDGALYLNHMVDAER